jgi:hypothetical protein
MYPTTNTRYVSRSARVRRVRGMRCDRATGRGEYIDGFYNPRRRHSHNSYLSPIDFEHQFMQQEIAS